MLSIVTAAAGILLTMNMVTTIHPSRHVNLNHHTIALGAFGLLGALVAGLRRL